MPQTRQSRKDYVARNRARINELQRGYYLRHREAILNKRREERAAKGLPVRVKRSAPAPEYTERPRDQTAQKPPERVAGAYPTWLTTGAG